MAQGRAGGNFFSRIKSRFSFGSGAYIGLSIGASSVKIVELSKKRNQWVLEKFERVSLLDGVSPTRDLVNSILVTNAIQAVIQQSGISGKNVCSAVTGGNLVIKNLTLMVTDEKELQEQVFWEAEQYIPFDINDVAMDFEITQRRGSDYDVMLVAAKRGFLDQYMAVIEESNLVPKIMDAEVFALQNVFESNYPVSSTEAVLLADVGALSTKIAICAGGVPLFVKDASFGGNMITEEIQRELRLGLSEAESLKVSDNVPREVVEIMSRMNQVLSTEIKKAMDYYTASSLGPPVGGIFLSGGGARAPGLTDLIERYTQTAAQLLNPLAQISVNEKNLSPDFLQSALPELAIPLGLAIRSGHPA